MVTPDERAEQARTHFPSGDLGVRPHHAVLHLSLSLDARLFDQHRALDNGRARDATPPLHQRIGDLRSGPDHHRFLGGAQQRAPEDVRAPSILVPGPTDVRVLQPRHAPDPSARPDHPAVGGDPIPVLRDGPALPVEFRSTVPRAGDLGGQFHGQFREHLDLAPAPLQGDRDAGAVAERRAGGAGDAPATHDDGTRSDDVVGQ